MIMKMFGINMKEVVDVSEVRACEPVAPKTLKKKQKFWTSADCFSLFPKR